MGATPRRLPELPAPLQAVVDELRLRARVRLAWLSHLQETGAVQRVLADLDSPEAEAAWVADQPELAELRGALQAAEAATEAHTDSPLRHVRRALGLGLEETCVLALVLATALDPGLRQLCGLLQGEARAAPPTLPLAARLFGLGRTLHLSGSSPLLAWELVQVGEAKAGTPAPLSMDPALVRQLLGDRVLDDVLLGRAAVVRPLEPLSGWPVGPLAERLQRTVAGRHGVVVRVDGPPGVGRRTFSACVAARLGLELLTVDPAAAPLEDRDRVELLAHRQAFLHGRALAWLSPPAWRRHPPSFPIQFLLTGPGHQPPSPAHLTRLEVSLPLPHEAERHALWSAVLPADAGWEDGSRQMLARRHRVVVGDVLRAARSAPSSAEEASEAVRVAMRGELGDLARRMPCPFGWEDLVLPEHIAGMLQDLQYEAQVRGRLWEAEDMQRLFPQGRGLLALFAGPPGTGKTMAAQVLAGSLGLDLYRIDLSALVSKYIGETAKNIDKVLSAAERLDVVLLFDEADSLYGKRTEIKDAHDRFANADTNHLLQAIEAWPGIAVLATNQKNNIDEAFLRRLRHVVDFPAPEGRERLRLWTRLVEGIASPEDAHRLSRWLAALAQTQSLSGAQIKAAVLTATIAAHRVEQPLSSEHLVLGVERELWKLGRGLSRTERQRLERHATG